MLSEQQTEMASEVRGLLVNLGADIADSVAIYMTVLAECGAYILSVETGRPDLSEEAFQMMREAIDQSMVSTVAHCKELFARTQTGTLDVKN